MSRVANIGTARSGKSHPAWRLAGRDRYRNRAVHLRWPGQRRRFREDAIAKFGIRQKGVNLP